MFKILTILGILISALGSVTPAAAGESFQPSYGLECDDLFANFYKDHTVESWREAHACNLSQIRNYESTEKKLIRAGKRLGQDTTPLAFRPAPGTDQTTLQTSRSFYEAKIRDPLQLDCKDLLGEAELYPSAQVDPNDKSKLNRWQAAYACASSKLAAYRRNGALLRHLGKSTLLGGSLLAHTYEKRAAHLYKAAHSLKEFKKAQEVDRIAASIRTMTSGGIDDLSFGMREARSSGLKAYKRLKPRKSQPDPEQNPTPSTDRLVASAR